MIYSVDKEFTMKKTKEELEIDSKKREFIKKFGSYAATAPIGMYMLMTPSTASAQSSSNNGWGNGDQSAPGNSGSHNNAENG